MGDILPRVRTAVVQAPLALFDQEASLQEARRLVVDAAAQGTQLTLIPAAFIPAYAHGLGFGARVGSRSATGRRPPRRRSLARNR